jgi:hypothetical protein
VVVIISKSVWCQINGRRIVGYEGPESPVYVCGLRWPSAIVEERVEGLAQVA